MAAHPPDSPVPPTTRTGRPPQRRDAPHGEDEVRASLLGAAIELFAERGPHQVSIRQVADAAGVNHGLVHYYFGSKEALIAAALDRCAADVADAVARDTDQALRYAPGGPVEQHGRLLAHVILDAGNPAAIQSDFPTLRLLIDGLTRRGVADEEARRRAALVSAVVLGWHLFGDFVTVAAGADLDADERAAVLAHAVDRLLSGP